MQHSARLYSLLVRSVLEGARRFSRKFGIRARLAFAFVLLSTLPALLLGWYRLDLYLDTLEILALQHVENSIALLKERLDGFLLLAERDLRSLGHAFHFQRFVRSFQETDVLVAPEPSELEAVNRLFISYLGDRPDYYRLRLLDREGSELIKIRKQPGANYQAASPEELEQGVGTYYLYRAQGLPPNGLLCFPGEILAEPHDGGVVHVITLMMPVTSDRGALQGLLVLEVLAEKYFEILEASGLPSLGMVAVADRDGYYLYHSEYRKDWNLLLAARSSDNVHQHYPPAVASRILSGKAGRISEEGEQIISFVPLEGRLEVPYVLFHAVPKGALFSSIQSFRKLFIALLLASALAAGLLAALAAKHFTDPIRALRSGASRLASGDLSHRIHLRTGDEVEELAHDFNAMAEAIEERDANLQALRDYQEDIVKSLNDGILVLDRDLTVRVLNPALSRMTGIGSERAVGRSFDQVFPSPKAALLRSAFERALGGEVVESEAMLPGASGALLTAELCFPMRNRKGQTTGVILRATDITDRRAAERALVKAKSTLQTIFDGIKAGIRLVSSDYRVVTANKFHERLLGKSPRAMAGTFCYAAFGGVDTLCEACPGKVALATGKAAEAEFECRLDGGRKAVLQVDAYPVFEDGDRPWGFIEFLQDISEKRRLERELERHANELEQMVAERTAALQLSEGRYRDLVENSPEMIHLLSPKGQFLHANKTEREKLGYSLDELVGMHLTDLVPSGERKKLARHQEELARTGRSRVETVFLPRRGDAIEVEIDATGQFDETGRLVHTRAFVRDITERKRMDERLFQTEKMVAVGQLASGLAHEIGTPLNAISGMAEFLLMNGEQVRNGREELEAIVLQTRRICDLVQRLLDFSRPSPPRRESVDVVDVLLSTLHLLARSLAGAGVRVKPRLPARPLRVYADRHQLQQVFTNIVLNAQQAMSGGGTLTIETRRSSPGRQPEVEIDFRDTGQGIAERNLKRIFEPFFTTKEVGKGTGLGLAICYSIVTQHRGTLRARNVHGQGAGFVVSLPLMRERKANDR
ncbi:MAG: PAS domain-containing protein [Acidobacteriota bacterium]